LATKLCLWVPVDCGEQLKTLFLNSRSAYVCDPGSIFTDTWTQSPDWYLKEHRVGWQNDMTSAPEKFPLNS